MSICAFKLITHWERLCWDSWEAFTASESSLNKLELSLFKMRKTYLNYIHKSDTVCTHSNMKLCLYIYVIYFPPLLQFWHCCTNMTPLCRSAMQVLFHDVVALTQKLFPIVEAMQKHFSAGSGAYYSDAIFFLSVAMHHIMPESKKSTYCHIS